MRPVEQSDSRSVLGSRRHPAARRRRAAEPMSDGVGADGAAVLAQAAALIDSQPTGEKPRQLPQPGAPVVVGVQLASTPRIALLALPASGRLLEIFRYVPAVDHADLIASCRAMALAWLDSLPLHVREPAASKLSAGGHFRLQAFPHSGSLTLSVWFEGGAVEIARRVGESRSLGVH